MLDDFARMGRYVDESALAERAATARALAERLARLSASAESPCGLVGVDLASSGAISDLRLREGVRDQQVAETARVVLAAIRSAELRLIEQVAGACTEAYGPGSRTGAAIVAAFRQRFTVPRAESST
jgi:hypothetical protein